MKPFPFIILLASMSLAGMAQNPDLSRKFGQVTEYELRMTSYEKDTAAHAVFLYENVEVKYVYNERTGFELQYYYQAKIKIFNQDAVDLANVSIPYYYGSYGKQENVTKLSATAYNLENGKIVKTQLDKKYVFRENVYDERYLLKFSIPEVKAGSVIEYRYMKSSDFVTDIPTLRIQKEYPVIYSYSTVEMPEYFRFNLNSKGYEPLGIERTTNAGKVMVQGEAVIFRNNVVKCEVNDVPALRSESHVWSMTDFRSAIEFELLSINMPYSMSKSYTSTWETVNEALEKSTFATSLKFSNPYKEEVAAISASGQSDDEKIRAIHRLVMSRIAWNDHYKLFSSDIREAVKTGVGTSADINFVLYSALKNAGYDVVPILLRPRQFGRLPLTRPSIDEIVTFIVAVRKPDGSTCYLDGTDRNSDINVFNSKFLVDRARIYNVSGDEGWVDLSNVCKNRNSTSLSCVIDDNGVLTATCLKYYSGIAAYDFKKKYAQYQSEDKYIESIEGLNSEISDYEMVSEEGSTVTEKYKFTTKLTKTGDMIYVKSTVLPLIDENPFNQQERRLPVELAYPYSTGITVSMQIPKGYVVDELPDPASYSVCEQGMDFRFLIQGEASVISSRAILNTNRTLYLPNEYEQLYTFMGLVADACQNVIVLRKTE